MQIESALRKEGLSEVSEKYSLFEKLSREELIHQIIALQNYNNQISDQLEILQFNTNQQIEGLKLGFIQSFNQYRLANTNQMGVYIQKLGLYEEEKLVVQKKFEVLTKQSQNKNQKIMALQKALSLYLNISSDQQQNLNQLKSQKHQTTPKTALKQTEQLIKKQIQYESMIKEQKNTIKELTQKLQQNNIEIKAVNHDKCLLGKQIDSLKVQLLFYKEEVEDKVRYIAECDNVIRQLRKQLSLVMIGQEMGIEEERRRLDCCVEGLKQQLKDNEQKLIKKQQQVKYWQQNFQQKTQQTSNITQQLSWYQQLLSQAKSNFLYSQLKNQQKYKALKKQNIQLKKQISRIKELQNISKPSLIDHYLSQTSIHPRTHANTHTQNQSKLIKTKRNTKVINFDDINQKSTQLGNYVVDVDADAEKFVGKENDRNRCNMQIKINRTQDTKIEEKSKNIYSTKSTKSMSYKNYYSGRAQGQVEDKRKSSKETKLLMKQQKDRIALPKSVNSSQVQQEQEQSFVTEYEISNGLTRWSGMWQTRDLNNKSRIRQWKDPQPKYS